MSAKPRILFVDDEQRVLNAMRGLFRRDFELFLTTKGAEAVRLVGEQSIDVLVADQRMPGMTGVEVLEQVKNVSPATVRILLTGYADLDAIEASINCGEVFRFLSKPCPPDLLRETLMQAVETSWSTAAAAAAAAAAEPVTAGSIEPPQETPQPIADGVGGDLPPPTGEPPGSASVVPFPGTGNTGSHRAPADDDRGDFDEVVLAGSTVTHQGAGVSQPLDNSHIGVTVYTIDPSFAETAMRAIQAQREASLASTLIAVTKILEEKRAGVLVTDFTDDISLLRSMIGTLKKFLPELVTIVASENRDASEMIALINYGQVFRYINKPLDTGKLLTDINAAVIKHQQLVQHPELIQRHAVLEEAGSDSPAPKLTQFVDHLTKIGRPWRHSSG